MRLCIDVNGKMYKDYSTAYKDAMNGNMQSSSITDLLPPGYTVSETQLKELLRKRKDTYRRYRDLSIFAFIGVYLLSVIDAMWTPSCPISTSLPTSA